LEHLAGGGDEMAGLVRAKNWAQTPLGAPESWPQSLKTAVRILLTSRFPMWLGWGDDLTFFYNDAYRPTLGIKHGWALGASAREVWKEIWPDIGPRIEHVLASGEATWDEALLLFLRRSGYDEETYHTFSYSPLADDAGDVVGMLCVVSEDTDRVIGERRLTSLRELASAIAGTNTRAEILAAARAQIGANRRDLPFSLAYLFDEKNAAHLAFTTGVPDGHAIAPAIIPCPCADPAWPAADMLARRSVLIVEGLAERFANVPTGAWSRPAEKVVITPIAGQGPGGLAGFLIAAANPYRPLDGAYLGFIGLIAGQIAAGLANADAYENERRRAEALAETDRAKTAFFSNVSHEFRTPLTLMLGPLEEVLGSGRADTVTAGLVEVAHRNGLRLLRLVNILLEFSRIEAGRVDAKYQPTDLAALTTVLASNFRSALDRAGLAFNVLCPPLPQPVHVDVEMWEKIVLNLISNAFKFTLEGEITVALATTADAAAAELVVRDTGIGVSAEELPRLFERFHRVEGTRGRSFEGTGIGLALVHELVKLHGGSIRVESEPDRGSTFAVTVPFGSVHLPADRIVQGSFSASTGDLARPFVEEALRWLPDEGGLEPSFDASLDRIGAPEVPTIGETGRVLLPTTMPTCAFTSSACWSSRAIGSRRSRTASRHSMRHGEIHPTSCCRTS
jgi:signal transduction histidine kinase